jgi:hypothetical protein
MNNETSKNANSAFACMTGEVCEERGRGTHEGAACHLMPSRLQQHRDAELHVMRPEEEKGT